MEAVKLFLGKFADLERPDWKTKQALITSVRQKTGLDLPAEAIMIKRHGIYLNLPPALKSLIFIHREAISAGLAAALKQPTIPTIV